MLIGDGRVDIDLRLPSERDLSVALGVSRTTVTRAYASLVESGFAVARQGSGTYTRVPGGRRQALDRTLTPHIGNDDVVDLSCAAPSAPPGIAAAYADAVQNCRSTSAGTATSRPACPRSRRRSPSRTTRAVCPPSRSRSWSSPAPCRR